MAFTLDDVKDYLRVDDDSDDDQISEMMEDAKAFVVNAVGVFVEDDPQMVMLAKAYTQNRYDHRTLMQSDQQQKKTIEYTFRSTILQLQMKYMGAES